MNPAQRDIFERFIMDLESKVDQHIAWQAREPVGDKVHDLVVQPELFRSHIQVPFSLFDWARATVGTNKLEDDKQIYRALQIFIAHINGRAMSRIDAHKLARKIGCKHGAADDLGFPPGSPLYQNWYADEWVIEAILEASMR